MKKRLLCSEKNTTIETDHKEKKIEGVNVKEYTSAETWRAKSEETAIKIVELEEVSI
jgi:hypothetical protein